MRDLVALSTLPAVWVGLERDAIARSLAEVLLNVLSLDLIYVRLGERNAHGAVEVVRSKNPRDTSQDESVKASITSVLRAGGAEPASSIPDPFSDEMLRVAVTRFGIGDDNGVLIAGSCDADFPTEQDRLLLSVGANQTAVVVQRRQAEQQVQEHQEWLQVTLASIGDAVITTDIEGRVTYLNAIAEQLTGWTLGEAKGTPLETVFAVLNEETLQRVESPVDKVLREGRIVGLANHTVLVARNGEMRPIDDSAAPIRDSTGRVMGVVMVFRNVTAQRKAEQRRNLRLAVTSVLNEAATLQDMASNVLRAVCEGLGWDLGLFWSIEDDRERLVCHAHWHRPDLKAEQLLAGKRKRRFKRGEGLPGRVWVSGRSEWIPDIAKDPTFLRADDAAFDGLRSAFACPVVIGGNTLGVIEFFSNLITEPDSDVLEIMGSVAANVGNFIMRQTAAEELRQSEAELSEFFEDAAIGLHWVGPDGTILRANRAELEMLGYARDEYIGRSIADFHVDEEVIRDILFKLSAGERLTDYPAQLRCKDGSIRDVLVDSSVMWKDGKFVHTRCFTRDITERKRAEVALADARARLDAALDAGAIATWTWDIPNNRLFADAHLARLFDLPVTDADGGLLENYVKAIHPDDVPLVTAALQRAVEGEQNYEAEYRILQADGSLKWVIARGRVQRDRQGRAVRMPGVLVDITVRKQLEEDLKARLEELREADRLKHDLLISLQESEEKLRLLADTIPQLAWMADPDGNIFWYNRRWYDYTGTTFERMAGWGWQSVHDPAVLPEVLHRWKGSIASGEPFEMVFPLKRADGEFRPFLTRVNPLRDAHGGIVYWFGTNTDISDFKRMEQALRDADRRKDEFLATLAHELRNPLAPIRNSLQILKLPRVDAAAARQVTDMMERQVHSLVRLVDDLLDVGRVTRGKIELRRERVELATVIARAVETAQSFIEMHGHELEISVPQESLLVDADPVRLAQVIANLLTNSAKYTEPRGHVWLSAKREGAETVICVRDDGIGIAPDMLPHVFELFAQADNAFTKAQGGLGIGLTLVKNLTELHGGTVEARSAGLGKGAEFVLRLPLLATDCAAEQSQAEDVKRPSSGHRLLVVDDNKDAAVSLAMVLELQGHEVRVAHDGPTALTLASSFNPKLIFLDIGMPDMDGYEVARRLREQPGLETVVLAALTGWGQEEDRRRSQSAGFNHHLVKPPEPNVLQRLLNNL